jgi:hypothetical protein
VFRSGFIVLAAIWLALPVSSLTAFGQEGNGLAIDVVSVDSSRFPGLSVVVNVLDDKGRPVPGLTNVSFGATLDSQPVTVDGLSPSFTRRSASRLSSPSTPAAAWLAHLSAAIGARVRQRPGVTQWR